jgi:hypothetical protein
MIDVDGTPDLLKELSNITSIKEWFSIIWRVGILIIVIVYIKAILKTIVTVLKAIANVFIGKDGKLDSKELMGATCWIVVSGCAIKYFVEDKYDITFLSVFLTYYCIMFGIEHIANKLSVNKTKNEVVN